MSIGPIKGEMEMRWQHLMIDCTHCLQTQHSFAYDSTSCLPFVKQIIINLIDALITDRYQY